MKNAKLVSWGIIISIAIAILNGISADSDAWYTICGLGLMTFSLWSAVILLSQNK